MLCGLRLLQMLHVRAQILTSACALHCSQQRLHRTAQVTDGAAAVLLMTRHEANRRNLPIMGIFRSFAAVRFAGC